MAHNIGKLKGKATGNGRNLREGAKLLARRKEVFNRWRAGEQQTALAKAFKVHKSTICLDIQLCLAEWRAEHRGSIQEHMEYELAKLHAFELMAGLDREESAEGSERARFVELMIRCSAERRKLLGIDAPSRSEIKNDTTVSGGFVGKDEMYEEALRALERLRDRGAIE